MITIFENEKAGVVQVLNSAIDISKLKANSSVLCVTEESGDRSVMKEKLKM